MNPWGHQAFSGGRFNLDGKITYKKDNTAKLNAGYTQIYRSGIIEAVNADLLTANNDQLIWVDKTYGVEKYLMNSVSEYFEFLKNINFVAPFFLFMTFINVKGYDIGSKNLRGLYPSAHGIDRDVLRLPEIELDTFPDDPSKIMKSSFELMWNACGFDECLSYDNLGNYTGY